MRLGFLIERFSPGGMLRYTLRAEDLPKDSPIWRPFCDVPSHKDFAPKSYLRPGLLRQLGLWTRAAIAKRQRLADAQFDDPLPAGVRFRTDGAGCLYVEPNPGSRLTFT